MFNFLKKLMRFYLLERESKSKKLLCNNFISLCNEQVGTDCHISLLKIYRCYLIARRSTRFPLNDCHLK